MMSTVVWREAEPVEAGVGQGSWASGEEVALKSRPSDCVSRGKGTRAAAASLWPAGKDSKSKALERTRCEGPGTGQGGEFFPVTFC